MKKWALVLVFSWFDIVNVYSQSNLMESFVNKVFFAPIVHFLKSKWFFGLDFLE